MKQERAPKLAAAALIVLLMAWGSGFVPHAQTTAASDTYIRAVIGNQLRSFSDPLATLQLVDGFLDIQGFHLIGPQTEELLAVHFPNPRGGGRWQLGSSGRGAWAGHFVRDVPTDDIEYHHTDETHGGSVFVTRFDPKQHIVEGTFEFDGALDRRKGPRRGPDTLRVRSGAFRVKYRVVPADVYRQPSRD